MCLSKSTQSFKEQLSFKRKGKCCHKSQDILVVKYIAHMVERNEPPIPSTFLGIP